MRKLRHINVKLAQVYPDGNCQSWSSSGTSSVVCIQHEASTYVFARHYADVRCIMYVISNLIITLI